jgi:hypothetical protein
MLIQKYDSTPHYIPEDADLEVLDIEIEMSVKFHFIAL